MLVLTRKQGEQIKIDGRIEVTVLSVQGHRVRLGIQAPNDVPVHRGELVIELERELSEEAVRRLATV
jgi:carbon storage regulator